VWYRNSAIILLILCGMGSASASCSVSVIPVAFGNYDPADTTALDATGSVNVTCNPSASYTIRLDPGANSASAYGQRAMLEPTKGTLIYYNLYVDPALTRIWGDGTGGTATASGNGVETNQLFHIFGRIPPGQNLSAGTYRDSVIVTVEW
jgi:spore coat protein U-like protein